MAPFLANYRETMPWVTEKPFIYIVVENTCNEAKLYDLDETGEGIVKGNFLYVKKNPSEWLKFNNRNFSFDSHKEFRKRLAEIQIKEIKCPEGHDFEEFGSLHEGITLQNLDPFCHWWGKREDCPMRQFIQALDRHSGKEKVTLDDIFLLDSMDRGVGIDVPWHVAKFLCHKAKGYNGLGISEMIAEILEVARDDDYEQFYEDFGQWRTEQERFISWNTDHLSQLLAHHHIDHTRYDGTYYSYVPSIPDIGI
ncbi:hypothetical protein Tco_1329333 [Tanacetum coccineum]